ncbi:response regulator [Shewanella sp. 1_MG-2023]|uniref:Response regulator n=1 Tax=Shewanella electrodiphila TaxID=934143 RepID=A0ABT0KIP7_9GAMM|nr:MULTISPECIES: response regulator [Shewanella]MCL1043728.1 response regulator [Shewanella electrodiphila]MDO6611254.1 response regulator [Shewanella sp. 7_MG-2023]MDO6771109.1 response regulator [Shewanella sp. 2_MG-2023]MDO6796352.1 response regulator [Shewanella sp. 1_MG-2023]PMG76909.1 two-component system response regulator [Shewanella sp. 10N.286.51.B7]
MNKLLIIEDDLALSAALARRLTKQGFECAQCNDASEGLLMARQFNPSHILLDMKIAEQNGLTLIKPLRGLLPKVKLVLLTGYASIATAVEAIRLGADNYLAKPVDTQTLLNALSIEIEDEDLSVAFTEQPISPKRLEWEHIQQVLANNNGNVSETARLLGMHRRTLQRKLLKKPIADNRPA